MSPPDRSSAQLRVVFWNTWLLAPRLWRGGPRMPGLDGWFGPDVDGRAPLVARALAHRFDVAALSEVFDRSEQRAVADGWPAASLVTGPHARRPKRTGSGLATLIGPAVDLVRTEQHAYRAGGDLRDSDTFATKGALFTSVRIHADLPPVEVISTHLFAGGDLFPVPGATDAARHHRVRMAQVDELVGFIERTHDPANPLLLVGDFNVAAYDPDPRLADPAERYRDLAAHLDRAQLHDLWIHHGLGPGPTCTFTSPDDLPPDPNEPDQVLDRTEQATSAGERIDYVWLHTPPGLAVEVERPRRWAFPGRGVTGGPAGSLSDHLALSVTLHISA